jgi:large subunit ribosomal protein L24
MMIESSKPRKQRIFRYSAPMHLRQHMVNAHISKQLSEKLGIKKRSIAVRKGDTVMVMKGSSKGKSGKVSDVDLNRYTVTVEGVVRKNAKGKELPIPINASNVYITDLNDSDKLRKEKIESFKRSVK